MCIIHAWLLISVPFIGIRVDIIELVVFILKLIINKGIGDDPPGLSYNILNCIKQYVEESG